LISIHQNNLKTQPIKNKNSTTTPNRPKFNPTVGIVGLRLELELNVRIALRIVRGHHTQLANS
jgi:hypothetical protein